MKEELIYLYRRKGYESWATCDADRYSELAGNHFFEVRVARHQHDYATLEAEYARLKNSLLEITARRFAESWKKRTSDAELEQYLSAGIAQLEGQRDKLAGELAAIRERHAIARRVVDRIGQLCTTPHESKERFIRRVQSVIEWEAQAINGAKPLSAEALQ